MNNGNKSQMSDERRKKLLDKMKKKEQTVRLYLRRRRRYRRTLLLFAMQIFTGILFLYINTTIPEFLMVTIPYTDWAISSSSLFFALFASNMVLYSILTWLDIRMFKEMSPSICLYASVSGAESIAQGKMVEGAFYVVNLFKFIKQYSDQVKVKIGPWDSKIRGLFLGIIENLYERRKALGKAIMDNHTQEANWSKNLYELANSLFLDEKDPNYDGALNSLQFFQEISEKYAEPATFAQKHSRTGFALKIVTEFLRATIVYILIFILWAIFGFR